LMGAAVASERLDRAQDKRADEFNA
jgi:hypothetical protein